MGARPTRLGVALITGAALALTLGLAACTSPSPSPSATPTESIPVPTPSAREPEILLGGTAEQNKPFFDQVNGEFIAAGANLNGAGFIDNLAAAGYPREDMEVTPDQTAIGLGADSIMFSVRLGDTCLIGQYGNIGYASTTTDLLSTGTCLIGTPHPAA
jgi:hypothetical protein